MKIINASYEIMDPKIEVAKDYIYKKIERVGRTCYKSEKNITDQSASLFIHNLIKRGHGAMLEHASITVKFTVDRGVTHEAIRHRVASFAQESTRYCNYSNEKFGNEITVIDSMFYNGVPKSVKEAIQRDEFVDTSRFSPDLADLINRYRLWYNDCLRAENTYLSMIKYGATPEEARSVLPTSLKAELVVTANVREWRHILNLRAAGTTGKPHPQIAEVMVPLCGELATYMPELFNDIYMKCMWGEQHGCSDV